jgi:TonB family protein
MRWCIRFSYALLFAGLLGAPHYAAAESDVERHLRDQYQFKILVLRGFYRGAVLHYGADGSLRDAGRPGDWTVDGVVQVNDFRVTGDRLIIRGGRIHYGWTRDSGMTPTHEVDGKGKPDKDEKKNRALEIEAEIGQGGMTAEAGDAAMAGIFLSSNDNFADLVPDYWKPCVRSALNAAGEPNMPRCVFSPEFLGVPGVAHASDSPAKLEPQSPPKIQHFGPRQAQPPAEENGVYKVGHGVSAPKATFMPNPEFNEEVRKAKYQGTVTLGLVVNEEGQPTRIHIISPIGCGLDAKAVQSVSTWKFQPAEKDGQPVPVEIVVETDFHLY